MKSLITNQININNYFQAFSREQEREADFYAIKTLNKLNLSPIPLIKFLNILEEDFIKKGISKEYQKFSSHPIYKERYDLIEQNINKTKYTFDLDLNRQFYFIKSKLFGFTENEYNNLDKYLEKKYLKYAKSIIYSKQGKLKKSIKLLNEIISENSQNAFLLETKGDILLSHGYSFEAKKFYEKTSLYYPKNHYVNKRLFDIDFSSQLAKNNEFSNNLFNKFSFLMNIFENDTALYNKFEKIAKNNAKIYWIEYFKIKKKMNKNFKNDLNKLEYIIDNLNMIIKKSNDPVLIKILKKDIIRLNNA